MTELNYFLLALPLLMADWQTSLVWVILLSTGVTSMGSVDLNIPSQNVFEIFSQMEYSGLEIWVIFLAVGLLRRFIFRGN
jgi:hypothetical protein